MRKAFAAILLLSFMVLSCQKEDYNINDVRIHITAIDNITSNSAQIIARIENEYIIKGANASCGFRIEETPSLIQEEYITTPLDNGLYLTARNLQAGRSYIVYAFIRDDEQTIINNSGVIFWTLNK